MLSPPVMVEFPENPRNAFHFESVPKAKGEPRLNLVAASTVPLTSSAATGVVVPMPIPSAGLWKICEFP